MRWIDALPFGANGCAVLPFVGKDDEGFFDTGNELVDHVYVSVTAVKEMARQLGWLDPGDVEDLRNEIEERDLRVQRLEDELNDTETVFQAIDVLESQGYTARKKAGRPKKMAA